ASGEIVLLLNDDVEPLRAGWMHRMVASAMQANVGAVGAQLLYPDNSVQHAGVMLGLGGTCAHLWRGLEAEAAARNVFIQSVGGRMAVTGACLAVRRSAYDLIGGFDEQAFPVAYNDIDFCLRLNARGLQTIYRGDAVLVHHESKSRGSDEASVAAHKRQSAEAAHFLRRWRNALGTDPFFSPAFDPLVESGAAHAANFAQSSDYIDPSRQT
ncbi:MAG: glycosyltransferase family 2 protein, partial [Sphingobacteriales bacterium]